MTVARYLIDTSALLRVVRNPDVGSAWEAQIASGLVAFCPVVELEVLYVARSTADRSRWLGLLRDAFVWVPMPDQVFDHATRMQDVLTRRGTHRSAGPVDLLVAATADIEGLSLLHYDRDFDLVAAATGQATTWVAVPGTVP